MSVALQVEQAGAVLKVRIDAGPGNLFTREMTGQLTELLRRPPDGVHVVHLSASGEEFCVGRAPFRTDLDALREDVAGLVGLNDALAASPAVTVSEVHGHAAGFGAGLVALSDVAIASPEAQVWFPEVDLGFAPALVLAWLAPLVGRRTAFWLTATGVRLSAREACDLGLVTDVAAAASDLGESVTRCIDLLLSKPPQVHAEIKRLLRFYATVPEATIGAVATDQLILASIRRSAAG